MEKELKTGMAIIGAVAGIAASLITLYAGMAWLKYVTSRQPVEVEPINAEGDGTIQEVTEDTE
jgi:hypothetical protein